MQVTIGICVQVAIALGTAFILSKTVTRMPDKLCRFTFLFVLGVPLNFVINYVNVAFLGYHKMGWLGVAIIALILAALGTIWLPQSLNSNTTTR